jgi:hypothetical protein
MMSTTRRTMKHKASKVVMGTMLRKMVAPCRVSAG